MGPILHRSGPVDPRVVPSSLMPARAFLLVLFVSCARDAHDAENAAPVSPAFIVDGALDVDGNAVRLGVSNGAFVDAATLPPSTRVVDLAGKFVVPAFIDSHVHLAYYPVAADLPKGGIAGAVDFAAPLTALASPPTELEVRWAGPMITPLLGYPTQGWGAGGFGLEVATPDEAAAAVDQILDAGASFIKTPLVGAQGVSDEMLAAVVVRAHERDVRVAVHALGSADATRAVASEVDLFGHTPTEALTPEQVAGWGERAVVGTLSAFGGSQAALDNLRALADAGALVLYGTDLGNSLVVGIQPAELDALLRAGFSGNDIVHSATDRAADYWGMTDLGRLEPEKRASFLVLADDPNTAPLTLATPTAVVIDGKILAGTLP
jgi:imidazolonepropionase-like amidohydrolase